MPSNHLILGHPLLLLPSILPSIRVFSNELALYIRWPEYWSFNISPSGEYSMLISFRMEWLDLLAVQGTLKSLLQHHSLKASLVLSLLYGPALLDCLEETDECESFYVPGSCPVQLLQRSLHGQRATCALSL